MAIGLAAKIFCIVNQYWEPSELIHLNASYIYIVEVVTKEWNGTINGMMHGIGNFHGKALFYQCSPVLPVETLIKY